MRDRNHLTNNQFNIQLEKYVIEKISSEQYLRKPVFVTPTVSDEEGIIPNHPSFKVTYPRDYRLLRSLIIVHWYFPESHFWKTHLDLLEMSFNQLNSKQKLELKILLSEKKIMINYLYKTDRYSGNEIFGNILNNDLKELFQRFLKTRKLEAKKPRKKVFTRGYKDKGSRVPEHRRLPRYDITLTEYQNLIERRRKLLNNWIAFLTNQLRD